MKSEKEKMLAEELYNAADPQLVIERHKARNIVKEYNVSLVEDYPTRIRLLSELIGSGKIYFEPPFYVDYGSNIHAGDNVFFNFNAVILDVARVDIGDNVMCGPNVQIYTATHPIGYVERNAGLELGKAIKIGSNCWIGGSTVICPGVTIGEGTVIGAGSVVTKDIPADVFAAGNPCKVIRQLKENPE